MLNMLKKTSRKPSAISRNPESESYVEEQTRASQQTIEIYGPGPSRGRFRRRDVHTPQRAVTRSSPEKAIASSYARARS
jgi:hypothetical protein